jgi:ATP-dependent protease ClpP protease subunit
MNKNDLNQLILNVHDYNINYNTRELYLHSDYNSGEEEPGVEYKMATTFIKNISILSNQSQKLPILVHMHSVGGEWNDGMAIFNTVRFCPNPITFIAYAQAYSMSGILLQCADRRILAPDCEIMIHYGSIGVSAISAAAKSAIDSNERSCKRMLEIFAKRAFISGEFFKEKGYTEQKVYDYLDKKLKEKADWYLSAKEAVYYGFADAILGEKGYTNINKLKINVKTKGII